MSSIFKPHRLLVLTASSCVGIAASAVGQVITSLVPRLNSESDIAPITTLSIDLLIPQRPFAYDPTGSSISSTALNPVVFVTNLGQAQAQTDTAIRDASQTGHISPYSPGASHAGESSVQAAGAFRMAGGAPPNNALDFDRDRQSGSQSHTEEGSSWGSSSSPNNAQGGSSWSGRATLSSYGENNQAQADGKSQGAGADQESRVARHPSAVHRPGSLRGSTPSNVAGQSSMPSGPRLLTSGGGGSHLPDAPLFSLPYGADYSLGRTPFSSPGGNGELTFLNPSILETAPPKLSFLATRAAHTEEKTRRPGLERGDGPATASTDYGIALHLQTSERYRSKTGHTSNASKERELARASSRLENR